MDKNKNTQQGSMPATADGKGLVLPILLADRGLDYLIELVKQIRPD